MNIQTKNLKENTIRISTVQFEDDFVGQLGENGNNVKYDPITGREYVYMSANNVKNCMKQTFTTLSMESPLGYLNSGQQNFLKNLKETSGESNAKEQAEVYTDISIFNPFHWVWGGFNPKDEEIKDKIYNKVNLKSLICTSASKPLHMDFVSTNKSLGVRRGKYTDTVTYKDKNKFISIDEIKDNKDYENIVNKTSNKSNIFESPKVGRGLYVNDYSINLNGFRYLDISNVSLKKEEKERLEKEGHEFAIVNNKLCLVVPIEIAIGLYELAVKSTYLWEPLSNNTSHVAHGEFIRTTFTLGDKSLLAQSIMGVKDNENVKAKINILTDKQIKDCQMYAFTSNNLKSYTYVDDTQVTCDVNAKQNAINKLIELGTEILKSI